MLRILPSGSAHPSSYLFLGKERSHASGTIDLIRPRSNAMKRFMEWHKVRPGKERKKKTRSITKVARRRIIAVGIQIYINTKGLERISDRETSVGNDVRYKLQRGLLYSHDMDANKTKTKRDWWCRLCCSSTVTNVSNARGETKYYHFSWHEVFLVEVRLLEGSFLFGAKKRRAGLVGLVQPKARATQNWSIHKKRSNNRWAGCIPPESYSIWKKRPILLKAESVPWKQMTMRKLLILWKNHRPWRNDAATEVPMLSWQPLKRWPLPDSCHFISKCSNLCMILWKKR